MPRGFSGGQKFSHGPAGIEAPGRRNQSTLGGERGPSQIAFLKGEVGLAHEPVFLPAAIKARSTPATGGENNAPGDQREQDPQIKALGPTERGIHFSIELSTSHTSAGPHRQRVRSHLAR